MPSKIPKWLSGYKPSNAEAMDDLISWMYSSQRLIDDIEDTFEKLPSSFVLDTCQRLFAFYKSTVGELQQFAVLLIPSLLHAYLCHSYEDQWSFQSRSKANAANAVADMSLFSGLSVLESCLVGICSHYLLNISPSTDADGLANFRHLRLPSLNSPSVYHDSVSFRDTVDRLDAHVKDNHDIGPVQRMPAVICLIQCYIDMLFGANFVGPFHRLLFHSLGRFAKLTDRICKLTTKGPRIPTSVGLLTALINCCDLILYKLDLVRLRMADSTKNNSSIDTIETTRRAIVNNLEHINDRATHHCFTSCILLCQSLLHYRTVQRTDKLSGLEYLVKSPVKHDCAAAKQDTNAAEVFTNASFRSETLAPDINPRPCCRNANSNAVSAVDDSVIVKATLKPMSNTVGRCSQIRMAIDHRRRVQSHVDLAKSSFMD